jgi:hypothetical protein
MVVLNGLIRIVATALPIAVSAIALQAGILLFAGDPQSVIALFARPQDPASLPAGASIATWDRHVVRLAGVDSSAVRHLYRQGALLVMPARSSGCMTLRKTDEPDGL